MMEITSTSALWFLPLAIPLCLWVMISDLRSMRIPNKAVLALLAVFVVISPFVLPLDEIAWRIVQLVVVLLIGMVANATGQFGAGDAKFCAAAAPFIAAGDGFFLLKIFVPILLASFIAHRIAKYTALRRLAPEWESWAQAKKFPMGVALGATLITYLALGIQLGK